jgi:UDP-galactopyranose mutase
MSSPSTSSPSTSSPSTIVIGAGPTGLSAAYHIGSDSLLLEQHDRVGGWCRSLEDGGFTFDYAGHIMFSNDPYVHELYAMLVGDNVHWQEREAWIYSKRTYTRYPFQGALYGLPPQVIKDCIVGAIEARFGPIGGARACERDQREGAGDGEIADCCADGVLEATAPLAGRADGASRAHEPENFEEFIYRVWGAGIAKHFAIPYNEKLWGLPLREMETSWLGGRVPLPDLEEMIAGAVHPVPKPMGPNARFGYVLRGGFQALMDGFLPRLTGRLELGARVARVSVRRHRVALADGRVFPFRHLVSTMPLPTLVRLLGDEAPDEVRTAAAKLRHVSVRCVNLGIGREKLTDKHWIYYPEDTVFHRIFVQGNASPHCNPPGGFGLTCEITYSPSKPLPCEGRALIERCIADCRAVGIIRSDDPVRVANQVDLAYAYVVYDHSRAASVAVIREWLARHDVLLAGRYSEWEYYNSDHAFLAGRKAAQRIAELQRSGGAAPTRARAARREELRA